MLVSEFIRIVESFDIKEKNIELLTTKYENGELIAIALDTQSKELAIAIDKVFTKSFYTYQQQCFFTPTYSCFLG